MKNDRFNAYIGEARVKWLREKAKMQDIKPSELLRRIIDEARKGEGE
jgi:hypothetical protein